MNNSPFFFGRRRNYWKNKKQDDISAYEDWYEEHQDSCSMHKGSAGKMEVDSVVEMFGRSEEKHGLKFVKYIGDGDSKTFKGIRTAENSQYEVEEGPMYGAGIAD